ncbi:flagellar biosynthesis protein FlhF [Bacillaceae bacterium]
MRIKKYVVDSMAEAMQQIRLDLGKDAIILNTREFKTGGIFGLFGRRKYEVIAAADEPFPDRGKNAQPSEKAATAAAVAEASAPAAAVPAAKAFAPRGQERAKGEPADGREEILREIQGIKDMFFKLITGEQHEVRFPSHVSKWLHRLRDQGVMPEIVQHLLEKLLLTGEPLDRFSEEETRQLLLQIVEQLFAERLPAMPDDPTVKLVHFFGPTGVGKTTTIAKLAAGEVLRQKRRVGMLTTDTYRIAAVEQLKTYANILNIPLEVVFSPEDLEEAVVRLRDCDVIFMDTAGRNYHDLQYVSEIKKYLSSSLRSENTLVLSLTSKFDDIRNILDNFSSIPISKVIFTKLDETTSYGTLLNFVYYYRYPLSYITNGQSVPDDIMRADPRRLAEYLLGVDQEDDGRSSTTPARIPAHAE